MAWFVALAASFTMTVNMLDRQALGVLAPSVTRALGLSDEAYGWLGAGFSMAYLVAMPFASWWIDRAGARRVLVAAVLAWSVVAGLQVLASGFGVLLALRIALAITEASGFPGAAQTVRRILPARDRGRGLGVVFAGSALGGMITPPLASLIARHAGWRGALLVTAAAGLIWIPLWIAATWPQAVRAQLDTASEAPSTARPSRGEIVSHRAVVRAVASTMAVAPILCFSSLWGAKYLVHTFALEPADVGAYLWLPPVLFNAGALGFGDLVSRQRGAEGRVPPALFAVAVALAGAIALVPLASTPSQAIWIIGIANMGGGALYTLNTSDLIARTPPGHIARASGATACAQALVGIVANPLIGRAVDQLGDYDAVAIAIGAWLIPGSLVWSWRRPSSTRRS
jgi:MFS transporter, ACS family, hexuronate transporter